MMLAGEAGRAREYSCTYIESNQRGDNMHMTERELKKRDAQRDLGAELLESVRQMAAGKRRVVMSSVISA